MCVCVFCGFWDEGGGGGVKWVLCFFEFFGVLGFWGVVGGCWVVVGGFVGFCGVLGGLGGGGGLLNLTSESVISSSTSCRK